MAEMEVGGVKFSGFGKIGIAVTVLRTLAGSAYVGYEFYFDYLDLREVVQEIDIDEIKAQNELVLTKLDDAIVYTRDIKNNPQNPKTPKYENLLVSNNFVPKIFL